jgi:hypothetical protein
MDDLNQKQIGHANDWLSDHGQKSFDELKILALSGTAESLERLHELADDNNISYNETTEPMDLAEKIYNTLGTDPNTGVE